jgi:signal transduction histidine kinase
MLQRTLAYEGFHVVCATNGHEALAEVRAQRPDVMVLDWLMPGMDGLRVLENLRAAGDRTLVLMLTARDAVENRVAGLEAGADDYLVKPFAPAELGQLALTLNGMLAELEGAYRQVEQTLDSQRRFVADASHELRTPLTTVRGNIELLRREPPLEAQERGEIWADTTEEVERLIRLVNQLLVLARADAGQALRREPLAVQPLLEDVVRQARQLSPRGIGLVEVPEGTTVLGDLDTLKQVLLILVDNALEHTPADVAVELAAASADGQVAISVHDTGPGIEAEALPHIFEWFYRGQVSRSGAGVGLGLAIARELVEAQGGTIAVESRPGEGSTFVVRLEGGTRADTNEHGVPGSRRREG